MTEPRNPVLKGPELVPRLERRVQRLPAVHGVGPSPVPPEPSISQAGSLVGPCPATDCGVPSPLDSQWQ